MSFSKPLNTAKWSMIHIVYFGGKVIHILNLSFHLFFQCKAVIWSYLQVVSVVVKLQQSVQVTAKNYLLPCGLWGFFTLNDRSSTSFSPFWGNQTRKQFITRPSFVPWHCEGNKTLFFFFPGNSGSKSSRGRSNWNNTDCLLPLRAGLTPVPSSCTRATYIAYLGCYLVAAEKKKKVLGKKWLNFHARIVQLIKWWRLYVLPAAK